jgi:hypothetical protein
MKLPRAKLIYNQPDDQTLRNMLEKADTENHKKNRDVDISPGRLIIKSPDGTRWSIEVDNSGNVSASSL